jgi:two-component system, LytTR family, sensor histidine kinase AlgZ
MCILLADFLRMTLGLGEKALVPLREELELLDRFLAIEKVRFGDRLKVETHVDAQGQSCLVPPLILQPLIENAVIHGIAHLPHGGTVRLSAECSEGRLHLLLENSVDPDAAPSRKGGLGLANVRQRLEARYGKDATLRTAAEEECFRVVLSLPAETPEGETNAAIVLEPETKQVGQ